jgi:hypothetical protein
VSEVQLVFSKKPVERALAVSTPHKKKLPIRQELNASV